MNQDSLLSIRMRASRDTKHISGAETLVSSKQAQGTALSMLKRALSHPGGQPDCIHITLEALQEPPLSLPILPPQFFPCRNTQEAQALALKTLQSSGVSPTASLQGLHVLLNLQKSLHGAIVCHADTGLRLDNRGDRGVRVSRMAAADPVFYQAWLHQQNAMGIHVQEALLLASKVVAAPGCLAELCWSDDPDYRTGYVASSTRYTRLPYLKPRRAVTGGRIFFLASEADLSAAEAFWQFQPVLLQVPAQGGEAL